MFFEMFDMFHIYSKGDVQLLWNQFSELHEPQVFKSISKGTQILKCRDSKILKETSFLNKCVSLIPSFTTTMMVYGFVVIS